MDSPRPSATAVIPSSSGRSSGVHRLAGCCLILALMGSLPSLSAAPPAGELSRDAILAEAGRIIERVLAKEYAVGFALGVIRGDETFTAGFGETARGSGVKPDAKSLFQIGSVTKTFVGVQLADLELQGRVRMDDPIDLYLPMNVHAPAWGSRKITLQDLATHYGGLPGLSDGFVSSPEGVCGDAYTLERLWNWVDGYRLRRSPGERFEYSNVGLAMLGHLLANVSGKSWEASCLDQVCLPLGMKDTRVTLLPEQLPRVCQGHRPDLDPVRNEELGALAPGGALLSTVDDLVLYCRAHLGTLPSRLYPAMRSAVTARASALGGSMKVALCWFTLALPTGEVVFYEGSTLGFNAVIFMDLEKKLGLVLLCNQDSRVNDQVASSILNLLYGRPAEPLELQTASKKDREELKAYAGRYLLSRPTSEYDTKGDRILAVELHPRGLKLAVPGENRTRLFPQAGDTFFRKDVGKGQCAVKFDRGPEGAVKSVTLFVEGAEKTLPRVD
ncbi:MAG: beta-lactamase family protein [Acidobacteria bacterium]|nr:beta-lactamase family protein [Acidobacteriota bacterium]